MLIFQLLYRSCLDSGGRIEELGPEPLRDVIKAVGGWNLTGNDQSGSGFFQALDFDLRRKVSAVQKFNSNALFHWYIREGMHNTSQYELFIHQGGLTLPSKEFYTRDQKSKVALFRYISTAVQLLGGNKKEHASEIHDLVEFEHQLAEISTRDDGITGMYVSLDRVDEWTRLSPTWGSWRDFFNEV